MVIQYMERFPTHSFRSSSLSVKLSREGKCISPQRLSKLLLEMHSYGILERFTRGSGSRIKSYYKIKKK